MVKNKSLKKILWSITLTLGLGLSLIIGGSVISSTPINAANAYDISGWQGYVNDNQARQLKNEVNFMILKAENGGLYNDPQFNHNAEEMSSHNIPYGAYDYSVYANPAQAASEAQALYQRAPQADFYVNDSEENDAGNQLDASTQAWANEMHQITTKPVVLYSDLAFMNNFAPKTRNDYDALWVAAYGSEPNPAYHYDLWQYTDARYSPALGESVDASVFPDGNNKPLSFWTGNGTDDDHITPSDNDQPSTDSSNQQPKSHVVYNPRYYRSNQIHFLQVTCKDGINLYSKNGKRIAHVNPGTILKVNHFTTVYYHSTGYITKAVGIHYGRPDLFTSKMSLVRWYHSSNRADQHKNNTKIVYNPHYYRSHKVHYLKVIGKDGINLYNMNGDRISHVQPGIVLWVSHYLTVHHRSTSYMTKAVGVHHGVQDLFTSRKDLVKWA